jgi:hypothetical protein
VSPLISPRASTAGPPKAGALAPAAPRLDERLFIACGLAWVTGLIHFDAAIQHVDEYLLYSLFFVLLAAAQCLWGVAVYKSPSRKLLSAGVTMSLLVTVLWIVSRTSGFPIGPQAWTPEPIGALDSIATANETVLAVLVFLQLRPSTTGALARGCRCLATGAALCLILLSSLALMGGHAH